MAKFEEEQITMKKKLITVKAVPKAAKNYILQLKN